MTDSFEIFLYVILICYIFKIFSSRGEMKFNFEFKTIPRCFWLGHLEMLLLSNLIDGWETFAESDLLTSFACLLGSG